MRLRLVNTTAFRLSLIYALLFSLLSTAALGFIYWNSAKEIRGLTDTQIKAETANLMRLYYEGSIHALTTEIAICLAKYSRESRLTTENPGWQRFHSGM